MKVLHNLFLNDEGKLYNDKNDQYQREIHYKKHLYTGNLRDFKSIFVTNIPKFASLYQK